MDLLSTWQGFTNVILGGPWWSFFFSDFGIPWWQKMAARRQYGESSIQMMDEISLWELCETEDRQIFPYFSYDVYVQLPQAKLFFKLADTPYTLGCPPSQ